MGTIRLKTVIPGPRTQGLLERRARYVPQGVSFAAPVFVERAEGAVLEDVDGNVFIDFAGGIAVVNAGHCPPPVVEAVRRRQAGRFLHTCFMVVGYGSYVDLVEALARVAPGPAPKKVMFVNSGAETVENGVKIARKDRQTKEPATAETAAIIQYAYEHGLILLKAGRYGNVLRFLPPLVITDDQLDEALSILEQAVSEAARERR